MPQIVKSPATVGVVVTVNCGKKLPADMAGTVRVQTLVMQFQRTPNAERPPRLGDVVIKIFFCTLAGRVSVLIPAFMVKLAGTPTVSVVGPPVLFARSAAEASVVEKLAAIKSAKINWLDIGAGLFSKINLVFDWCKKQPLRLLSILVFKRFFTND